MINNQFTRLSSSLRSRSAEESLAIAESLAMSRGVSRVVDTTWLDRIGIPVYSTGCERSRYFNQETIFKTQHFSYRPANCATNPDHHRLIPAVSPPNQG